jgi:tetratricopeptide repeat protein
MADATRVYEELIDAARRASNQGNRGEAERLLIEALVTGERAFGGEHPSLGTVLNELGRLYIRQSQHKHAEEVLERLLRITKSKGEEHPDVATALAGLALVKRALGDDAAAEQLYRDALRIRERALAPQHMATVVTMEQLSEICAARNNVSEALALLQRALPTREAALGAEHATVRTLRARIAELELRALASTFAATAPKHTYETPAVVPAVPPTPTPKPGASIATPSLAAARRPRRKRVALFAFAGVTAVALATVGMTTRSRAEAGSVHSSASVTVQPRAAVDSAAVAPSSATTPAPAAVSTPVPDSARESSTGIVQAGAPIPDSAPRAIAPKLPRAPKNLAALTVQFVPRTDADSLVRASTKIDRELTDKIGPGVGARP